jgi:hypothetical protein
MRWQLEALGVPLYAQELQTPYPISYKRLEKFWNAMRWKRKVNTNNGLCRIVLRGHPIEHKLGGQKRFCPDHASVAITRR